MADEKPSERYSAPLEDEEIVTDPDEVARLEAVNGVLQFDSVVSKIQAACGATTPYRLRPSTILELNRLAVQKINRSAGSFRTVSVIIHGSDHQPPAYEAVPGLVEELCDYVNENWSQSPLHLAGYVLWRLNWIHPFVDGNGRTARATSYLIMNIRLGYLLPGTHTVPEQIAANKQPYYSALEAADAAFSSKKIDVGAMEELLGDLLARQLVDIWESAKEKRK